MISAPGLRRLIWRMNRMVIPCIFLRIGRAPDDERKFRNNIRIRECARPSSSVWPDVMRLFISASAFVRAGFGAEENHGRAGAPERPQRVVRIAQKGVDAAFGPPRSLSGISSSACSRAWLSLRKKLLS